MGKIAKYRLIHFFLGALLPPKNDPAEQDFYQLLGVRRNATYEEIRRAFRQRAIVCHPDKQMQRSSEFALTDQQTEHFQRLKAAYETLMDPNQRKIYDTMGGKAVLYIAQQQSLSYTEVLTNLSRANCWSRSKLNFLVFLVCGLIILQPVLICLNIDLTQKQNIDLSSPLQRSYYWPWLAILTPLWCFNIIVFDWLGSLLISSKDQGEEDDASYVQKQSWLNDAIGKLRGFGRYKAILFRLTQFTLIVLTEIILALKMDSIIEWQYQFIFIPLFIHQVLQFLQILWTVKHIRHDISRMITLDQVVQKAGKPYYELTDDEKRVLNQNYVLVHIPHASRGADEEMPEHSVVTGCVELSDEYKSAKKSLFEENVMMITIWLNAGFLILLVNTLENQSTRSWWIVFTPILAGLILKLVLTIFQASFPNKNCVRDHSPRSEVRRGNEKTKTTSNLSKKSNPKSAESRSSHSRETHIEVDDVAAAICSLPDMKVVETPRNPPQQDGFSLIASSQDSPETLQSNSANVEGQKVGDQNASSHAYCSTNSAQTTCRKSTNQCFKLLIATCMLCLFIGKLQGATYSSVWIVFPIILPLGLFFLCFCSGVYCVTDISEDEGESEEYTGQRRRFSFTSLSNATEDRVKFSKGVQTRRDSAASVFSKKSGTGTAYQFMAQSFNDID